MGLSTEALKYSLSFVDRWFEHQIQDTKAAREEFLAFYKARNYSSLLEYLSDISQDLRLKSKSGGSHTWYECRACAPNMPELAERTILAEQFCYIFHMKPMEHGFGMYSGIRWIDIQYQSKTAGLLGDSDDWGLYFSKELGILVPINPPLTIRTFRQNTVLLTIQKFVSLNRSNSPCRASTDVNAGKPYWSVKCMTKCHNAVFRKYRGCGLLWLAQSRLEMTPEDTCNQADRIPPENWTLQEFLSTPLNEHIDAVAATDCVKQCPRRCDKFIYSTILQMQENYLESDVKSAREVNATLLKVSLRHGNVYQAGTVISEEVYFYSFTELINNVGGTLGLFLGATLMTIVQLLLFCIKYAFGLKFSGKDAGQ